ncbi:MAG: rhodanese-like domain-containing protein [Tissierellia bacterium]|nr:rhodanese-like domain-containing protein [Tissierellia bacterium]MDD4726384.1 rhodanese-like domain-containing protein [Tissierellia bacterium]
MKIIKLILLLLAISIVFIGCDSKTDTPDKEVPAISATDLTIDEAKELITNQDNLLILDVRSKEEFDSGHIEGAVLIPLDELENRLDEIEDYKDDPILVYCRSGNRSSKAVRILLNNEFTEIYHMNQGYMNWK